MDSYPSTVMQQPQEEDEEGAKRGERINGGPSSSNTTRPSPTTAQTPDFHSPYSPNGTHPRPQFTNPYHPPTPATLSASHIPGPTSPRTLTTSAYQADYQPAPRDKPTSNYYDPTSDSGDRQPSESAGAGWNEGQSQTPQV